MSKYSHYILGLFTPILCGVFLVQLCFQIIWDIVFKNEIYNEMLACVLLGSLFYGAFLCLLEQNCVNLFVSGLFYFISGVLSYFIKGFEIIFLGFTFSMHQIFFVWIFIGIYFIYQSYVY